MTAHDYMSWSAQLDVPTTGIQRSYYLPDGESHGLSSASERDQTWFGLSQICLTSHADRLTIGGGARLRATAALNERFPEVQLGCRILSKCLTVLL